MRRGQESEEGAIRVAVTPDVTAHRPVAKAVSAGIFDPRHGGSGVAQKLGAIGPGDVIGQVEDTQPLEAGQRAAAHGALGDARSAVAVAWAHS